MGSYMKKNNDPYVGLDYMLWSMRMDYFVGSVQVIKGNYSLRFVPMVCSNHFVT